MKTTSKKDRPTTLWGLVFDRLHTTAAPLLRYHEVAPFLGGKRTKHLPASLVELPTRAEDVPHPRRPESGDFVPVRRTSRGWYAVAPEGEFFKPIPIGEQELRQFRVSLPAIVDQLRLANGIEGTEAGGDGNLIFLGQKQLAPLGSIEVYFAVQNDDPAEFAARCRAIRRSSSCRQVMILVPRPVGLTGTQRQLLTAEQLVLVSLKQTAQGKSLEVDWQTLCAGLSTGVSSDGPRGSHLLVWKGREHRCKLTEREQRFLELSIDKEFLEIAQLIHSGEAALWRELFRREQAQRNLISRFLSRLNRNLALAKPPVPLSFALKRGTCFIQRKVIAL